MSVTQVYFNEAPTCNEATDKAIPPTGGKTPLEAAMVAANTYVETLHKNSNLSLPILFDKSSRMRWFPTSKVRNSRK